VSTYALSPNKIGSCSDFGAELARTGFSSMADSMTVSMSVSMTVSIAVSIAAGIAAGMAVGMAVGMASWFLGHEFLIVIM